jgi:hypothetical protein
LRKKWALGFFVLLGALAPGELRGQFLGFTSPQTVTQQVFAGQTTAIRTPTTFLLTCTPTNGTPCAVKNQGQTFHYFTYTTSSALCVVDFAIQASYDGVNFFNISADANFNSVLLGNGNASGGISAQGWFPILAVNLINISNCAGGVNGFYTGSSAALTSTFGVFQQSDGQRQTVLQNTNLSVGTTIATLPTPYGSAGGKLLLICTVTCGAGTNVFNLLTAPSPPVTQTTIASFTATNSTTLQTFTVPPVTAQYVSLTFPTGNFATTNATVYYEFDQPSTPAAFTYLYREINSNATTQLRTGAGVLNRIVINAPGSAWTLQVFDNTTCTGTAIAGATAFTITGTGDLSYNVQFNTGLCLLTAGTTPGSMTVSYR